MFGTGALIFGLTAKVMLFGALTVIFSAGLLALMRAERLDSDVRADVA